MKRTESSRRAHSSEDSRTGILAALVGHELNNIAVPLAGFAELAMQGTTAGTQVRDNLEEMRLAIVRIKALASELESLAEPGERPRRVAIGDCLPGEALIPGPKAWSIDWRLSAATLIKVDPVQAQRAIRSLTALALPSRRGAAPALRVSRGAEAAGCIACAAAGSDLAVCVQVDGSRRVPREAFREPLADAAAHRTAGERLALAVLVHSAHCAGGHLLLDEPSASISVAFPSA